MNSRELVLSTLEYSKPGRVPRELWQLPWTRNNYPEELERIQRDFPSDISRCPAFLRTFPKTEGNPHEPGRYVDPWGCVFENRHKGLSGEVKVPLVQGWEDMEKVHIPEEWLTVDVEQVNEFCREEERFVLADCCPCPFEQMQFIRGAENVYMDLVLKPDGFEELLKKVHDLYCRQLDLWAQTEVDGLMFIDDWGSQRSLMISPRMWRDIFKPLYAKYIEIAHQHGKKIFMHSDGYIIDIIGDLIEIGLDALNSQIFCMGLKNLEQFKGQLTFWGEIDRQHILPEGSRQDVVAAVHQVKQAFYSDGGVIAQCEFGPGAKPENIRTVFETWNRLDEG